MLLYVHLGQVSVVPNPREHQPMTVFVKSVDVDAAWEVYYQLADRRHKDGLTIDELRQVIEAALVGVVEAERDYFKVLGYPAAHRYRSEWVEVEEHQ